MAVESVKSGLWKRRDMLALLATGAVGAVGALAACGGGSEPGSQSSGSTASEPRPLTNAEATLMADVLYKNYSAKGAVFNFAGRLSGDDSLAMSGEVDWANHVGHAMVRSKVAEAKVTEIFWNERLVVERRPQLTQLMTQLNRGTFEFFLRPPAIDTRELDQALAVIMGLASQQRDNPQLIRQTEGSAYVRADTLRDTPVDVLRYGQRNSYWVAKTGGALLRLEANSANGARPRIVDLLALGPQTITPPDGKLVIDVAQLGELWEAEMAAG